MVVSKPYPKVKEQELQTLCKNISKLTKTKGFNNKHNKDERMKEKNYTPSFMEHISLARNV